MDEWTQISSTPGSLYGHNALPLILTRICSSSPSVSAAWGYQTRPLGMPMGQVEGPSYGIRGGAAEEGFAEGAPSSAHPTIRKGYELQVTFLRRPGGRKPYTSNSFANEDGDLFKAPQLTDQRISLQIYTVIDGPPKR